jgi:Kdo2-lipid IVA lauroyltransferase/acyltransferase
VDLLSRLLGALWWWCIPIRRKEAVENHSRCFPNRDPTELRRGFGEMAVQYAEIAMGRRARIEMPKELEEGGILLAGHGGAFDLALVSLAERLPVTIFLRRPSSRLLRRAVEGMRQKSGLEALYGRGVKERAYRALQEGRVVIFVQDQRHSAGIETLFFGRPCLTSPAFAAMAWRSKAKLYGAWQWREPDGHRCLIESLPWKRSGDRATAIAELSQASQDFYERQIRSRPHGWLWLHRRWKT